MDNKVYDLGGYKIECRADGMFNATYLFEQWNEKNDVKKRFDMFMRSSDARDVLIECQINGYNPVDRVKGEYTVGRPKETVWLHNSMLVPLTRWLSPQLGAKAYRTMLKVETDHVLYDDTIEQVNKLKDIVLNKFGGDYERVKKCLNYIVYGGEKELEYDTANMLKMDKTVSRIVGEIEYGIIKDYNGLISRLGEMYKVGKN